MLSVTEENYLKAIYKIAELQSDGLPVSTNAIAHQMNTKAPTVTDMIKRLADKSFLEYVPYKGVFLKDKGEQIAKQLIRKHRLWEVFLVEKLQFNWAEVHPIAEQLEHIESAELILKLEQYLNNPKYDPHGDPIPDEKGNINYISEILLAEVELEQTAIIVGVKNYSKEFLVYLESVGLLLGTNVLVQQKFEYDSSIQLKLNGSKTVTISQKVSSNLFVKMNKL